MVNRMQPLVIRADAGAEIGIGHVMRTLALAEAWQEQGGAVHFVSTELPPSLARKLAARGIAVTSPDVERGSIADAQATVSLAASVGAAWIVADGYALDQDWQGLVRSRDLRLMVIDDYAHLENYDADVLVNQNPGMSPTSYHLVTSETVLLLGSRYALVRDEFRRARQSIAGRRRRRASGPGRILVTLGGADPRNMTHTVLEALEQSTGERIRVTCVVGGASRHAWELAAAAARLPYPVRLVVNPENMAELMAGADLAISAAGSTTWELALLGVPTLHVVVAENQVAIAKHAEAGGYTVNLGACEELSAGRIAGEVNRLLADDDRRAQMSAAGRQQIDGRGAERVVSTLVKLAEGTPCVSLAS